MALRVKWPSRTLAVRAASRWAGRVANTGPGGEVRGAPAAWNSSVLMVGLLPRRRREAVGDDLAEHHRDLLAPRRRKARPESIQRWGRRRGLRARGGTRGRRGSDMGTLLSARRGVPGTTAPAGAARPR